MQKLLLQLIKVHIQQQNPDSVVSSSKQQWSQAAVCRCCHATHARHGSCVQCRDEMNSCMSKKEVRCYLSVADVAQRAAAEFRKGSPLDLHHQNSDDATTACSDSSDQHASSVSVRLYTT